MSNLWPADFRDNLKSPEGSSKSKGKAKAKNTTSEFDSQRTDTPLLQIGSRSAATLVNKNGRLDWVFAAENCIPDDHQGIPSTSRTVELIPESSTGRPVEPRVTPLQRAEQGAQFLRIYHPDIDIEFDLLREHIMEEHKEAERRPSFDPYIGNQMAVVELSGKTDDSDGTRRFLLYSFGETGSQMNVSPFNTSSEALRILVPHNATLHDFQTTIQQIVASGSVVVIRTSVSVFFASLVLQNTNKSNASSPVRLELLGQWDLADTQGKRVMDVTIGFCPESGVSKVILVDSTGTTWEWRPKPHGGFVKEPFASPPKADVPTTETPFWRVGWGNSFNDILLMSHKCISTITPGNPGLEAKGIFKVHAIDGQLTSMASSGNELLWACTTFKLFLIDLNNPEHPLLSWKHNREEDFSLEITVISSGTVALTSNLTGLVSYYTVMVIDDGISLTSQSASRLFTSSVPRQSLLPIRHRNGPTVPRLGMILLKQQHTCDKGVLLDIYELSSRRGVSSTRIHLPTGVTPAQIGTLPTCATEMDEAQWPRALTDTVNFKGVNRMGAFGSIAVRESTTHDLRGAYERLFNVKDTTKLSGTDDRRSRNDADATFETLDMMKSFWQDLDVPIQYILTTHDIAFQSGRVPERTTRTDFLKGNSLNTKQGCRILVNSAEGDSLPISELSKAAGWSWDLGKSIRAFASSNVPFPDHPHDLDTSKFKPFDAQRSGWVDPAVLTREENARNELAVDLAMSLNVYSSEPFRKSASMDRPAHTGTVEEATTMLSKASLLVPEPPEVEYGFLQPMVDDAITPDEDIGATNNYESEHTPHGSSQSLGARLLLQEWRIGEDPSEYTYEDPYGSTSQTHDSQARTSKKVSTNNLAEASSSKLTPISPDIVMRSVPAVTTSTKAPPKLTNLSSSTLNRSVSATLPMSGEMWSNRSGEDSGPLGDHQEGSLQTQSKAIPSTQPVSGPFGRRQGFDGKRKPKRVGGF